MASMMMMKQVLAAFLIVAVVASSSAEAAMSCGTVSSNLAGCMGYLTSGGTPSPGCCNGVKALNSMAKSPADRQAACGCLKQAAQSMPGLNPSNAQSLPGKCGVDVGYPISPSIDCSKVH